jgi:hypothetical protein
MQIIPARDSSVKEPLPSVRITMKIDLRKWADPGKVWKLLRQIERDMNTTMFTQIDEALMVAECHVMRLDLTYWEPYAKTMDVYYTQEWKL